jgi:hypothetical protein
VRRQQVVLEQRRRQLGMPLTAVLQRLTLWCRLPMQPLRKLEKLPLVVMQRLSIWQMIIFRISKELNVT